VARAVAVGYQRDMRRAWFWAALVILGSLAAPTQALAGVPTRLVYVREPSARECPDETALASAVAARLGYDPFSPWGDQTVLATISRANGGLVAQAQLIDHDGIAQGTREVKLPRGPCDELILALALAISITLDPLHGDGPKARSAQAAEEPPTEVTPAPEPISAPAPESRPSRAVRDVLVRPIVRESPRSTWHGEVAAFSALGFAPAATFGTRLGLEARLARWSVALEGWAVLPATTQVSGGGAIETSLLAAALVPCFEPARHWRLCAIGSLGSLAASGREIDVPRSQRVLHATAGARARLVWPLGARFELLANADLAVVLNRPQFQLDRVEVWRPGPLLTVLALGASVRFF
jgi:hypothetical protein